MNFTGQFKRLTEKAQKGTVDDVDYIMDQLDEHSSFATTRFVDFALSLIKTTAGIERIKHYLFNGNMYQRNYACLYFSRVGEWQYVHQAYQIGAIDWEQAYSR